MRLESAKRPHFATLRHGNVDHRKAQGKPNQSTNLSTCWPNVRPSWSRLTIMCSAIDRPLYEIGTQASNCCRHVLLSRANCTKLAPRCRRSSVDRRYWPSTPPFCKDFAVPFLQTYSPTVFSSHPYPVQRPIKIIGQCWYFFIR